MQGLQICCCECRGMHYSYSSDLCFTGDCGHICHQSIEPASIRTTVDNKDVTSASMRLLRNDA